MPCARPASSLDPPAVEYSRANVASAALMISRRLEARSSGASGFVMVQPVPNRPATAIAAPVFTRKIRRFICLLLCFAPGTAAPERTAVVRRVRSRDCKQKAIRCTLRAGGTGSVDRNGLPGVGIRAALAGFVIGNARHPEDECDQPAGELAGRKPAHVVRQQRGERTGD